jgi:hypothetical protein
MKSSVGAPLEHTWRKRSICRNPLPTATCSVDGVASPVALTLAAPKCRLTPDGVSCKTRKLASPFPLSPDRGPAEFPIGRRLWYHPGLRSTVGIAPQLGQARVRDHRTASLGHGVPEMRAASLQIERHSVWSKVKSRGWRVISQLSYWRVLSQDQPPRCVTRYATNRGVLPIAFRTVPRQSRIRFTFVPIERHPTSEYRHAPTVVGASGRPGELPVSFSHDEFDNGLQRIEDADAFRGNR